jgi:hypothetical protein
VSLKMWRSALRRRPLFDSQSRGGAAAQPLSGVAMPDQTRWTGRTNVKRAASIAPCLRRPPALSLLHFVLPRGPTLPHPTLWQKHRRSPAGSILPAWRALESDRLRCRWGPTRLRCTTGHLPGCYTDDIVYWFANLRLQDSVQHRVSGTVSWCFPAAAVASQLAPRLFVPSAASELSPFAPIARLGALDDYHPSTGSSALVPQDGPHYLGWYMLCLPSYFYGSCHRMPRPCPTPRCTAQRPV